MPELPEVETIIIQLAPAVRGRVVEDFEVLDERLTAPTDVHTIRKQVEGRKIRNLSRRGKYLRFELDNGSTLVLHLRMTGRMTLYTSCGEGEWSDLHDDGAAINHKHLRLVIVLDNNACLAFHDPRRFGTASYLQPGEGRELWEHLGPEPLERSFTRSVLTRICHRRSKAIKSTLMDQRLIAGIGNIYADEALFRSRIRPDRGAGDLSDEELSLLCREIKTTLRDAIRLQGSSIDTYADTKGRRGSFQETFKVHRREGKACPVCGQLIEKTKVGGRGTYYCPDCQC